MQESIVRLFVERYGRNTTLGELLAASIGIRRIAEGERLCVTHLAQYSGEAISSVSRWLNQLPHVELVTDDVDQRRKSIRITDQAKAYGHLPSLQQLIDQ
jgi:DNA-binding transcriptional ArsR family regulator